MELSYTLIFVVITVLISLSAFNNSELNSKLILYPRVMNSPSEYYRLLTSGFIHADTLHLVFNMYALYGFGRHVEAIYAGIGKPYLFPILYILGIITSSLPDMARHKNNSYFASLGASGGVSSVILCFVYFYPWEGMGLLFLPPSFKLPAIVFAALYLAYCVYAAKKSSDNINHNAHFWGGIFGLVFSFLFDPNHGRLFWYHITHPPFL